MNLVVCLFSSCQGIWFVFLCLSVSLFVYLFIFLFVCFFLSLLAVLDFVQEGDVKICQRWRVLNWRKSFQDFVEFVEGGTLALEFIIM